VDLSATRSEWYVMLFPARQDERRLSTALKKLATRTGGTVSPGLHVTVGYFNGAASPESIVERLRPLTGPALPIRASGLVAASDRAHPLYGYVLWLRVARDEGIRCWQQAARDAVEPLALTPTFSWDAQDPHMQVLRHLPSPPGETLARLDATGVSLDFTASRLVFSQRVGDEFVTWLDQPLSLDDAPTEPAA